jgi:hypothetical protein
MISGIESTCLRYWNNVVATPSDNVAVQDSEQATQDRKIHGIILSSGVTELVAPAAAATGEATIDIQVGFNSQANAAGILATLMNKNCVSQQGAVTPAPFANNGSANLYVPFSDPIKWPEGATISLIVHYRNDTDGTCSMEATATILYTD